MTSPILYLTQTEMAAEDARRHFPRSVVEVAPLAAPMGRRGEVVVVEPLRPGASEREQEQFQELLDHAHTKARDGRMPVFVGRLVAMRTPGCGEAEATVTVHLAGAE